MNYYNAIILECCFLADTAVSQKLDKIFKSGGGTKGRLLRKSGDKILKKYLKKYHQKVEKVFFLGIYKSKLAESKIFVQVKQFHLFNGLLKTLRCKIFVPYVTGRFREFLESTRD